jgi:REP element-mobilizing transposase RayT
MATTIGTRKRARQLELHLPKRGGKRKRAGRTPKIAGHPGMPHTMRPCFARTTPVHVTVRVAQGVYNLRSKRSFRVVEGALYHAADRFDVRVIQFSVQGNHIHFLVEARNKTALSRAIQGLSIRFAKAMNRMMGRKTGRVMGDRYHARLVRTPTETKRVIHYIRDNHRQHMAAIGNLLPPGWVDPFSSDSLELQIVLPAPETWLLSVGWQRGSP